MLQEAEGLCLALVEARVHLICRQATVEVEAVVHRRAVPSQGAEVVPAAAQICAVRIQPLGVGAVAVAEAEFSSSLPRPPFSSPQPLLAP